MTARGDIFASIRTNLPRPQRPLPHVPLFDDHAPASDLSTFKESLLRMGGTFLDPPASGNRLAPVHAKITGAKIMCSTVPEIVGNRDIAGVRTPQDLADVDFAIVRAAFAVAETASVLLGDRELRVNALAYLAQHLIVLLDPADIVINLHHAYRRPELRNSRFSYWPVRHGRYRGGSHPRCPGRPIAFRPAPCKSGNPIRPMNQKRESRVQR